MTSSYPSEDDFRKVFALSSYWLSKPQKRMMKLLFCASSYTMTATEMALALGYDSYSAINLHFGSLGDKVAKRMKYTLPTGQPSAAKWYFPQGWTRRSTGRVNASRSRASAHSLGMEI